MVEAQFRSASGLDIQSLMEGITILPMAIIISFDMERKAAVAKRLILEMGTGTDLYGATSKRPPRGPRC